MEIEGKLEMMLMPLSIEARREKERGLEVSFRVYYKYERYECTIIF